MQAYERYKGLACAYAVDQVLVDGLGQFFQVVGWDARIGGLCTTSDLLQLFENGFISDRLLDTVTNLVASLVESTQVATKVAVADTNIPLVLLMDDLWTSYATKRQLTAVR
jgi:hypothetical protein